MPLALAIMRQGKRNIISARVLTAVEELIDSPKECPLPVPVLEFICSMCAALLCPGLLQKERAGHTWRKPRRKSRDSKGSKESAEATFSIMGKVTASITLRRSDSTQAGSQTEVPEDLSLDQSAVDSCAHDALCSQRRSTLRHLLVKNVAQQGATKGLGDIMAEMTQDQCFSWGLIGVQDWRAVLAQSSKGRQSSFVTTPHLTIRNHFIAGEG